MKSETFAFIASVFVLRTVYIKLETEAVLTSLTTTPTQRSYMLSTPYESILLALILAQVSVLQAIGVLPININKFLYGDPSGRRKRSIFKPLSNEKELNSNQELVEKILSALRGLDKYECVFRTLCEVQKQTIWGYKPPNGLRLTIDAFQWLGQKRQAARFLPYNDHDNLNSTHNGTEPVTPAALPYFAEAVQLGKLASVHRNSTNCEQRYSHCAVTGEEIMSYIEQMHLDDLF